MASRAKAMPRCCEREYENRLTVWRVVTKFQILPAGKRTKKLLPFPNEDSAQMSPP